jgi:hypothetical protein
VSACKKHSISDVAASAPAFICTALPLPEHMLHDMSHKKVTCGSPGPLEAAYRHAGSTACLMLLRQLLRSSAQPCPCLSACCITCCMQK